MDEWMSERVCELCGIRRKRSKEERARSEGFDVN